MARIWQCGFELNSTTSNEEWTSSAGSPTISLSTKRSGAASCRVWSFVTGTPQRASYQWRSAISNGPFYFRAYLNIGTAPSAENIIIVLNDSVNVTTPIVYITVDNGRLLRLYDEDGVVGSASSALSLSTWYRIEIAFDRTPSAGSHVVRAYLDGTEFAGSATRNLSAGIYSFNWGGNCGSEANTAGNWYFDDLAINDSTGSYQNGLCGDGKIIHLRPSAAGDSNEWLNTAAGAGDANNYTLVDEDNPDDATTMVQSVTANAIDMYNVADSGIGSSDVVNCVMVGGKFRNNTADATTSFRFRIEKTSSGTVTESASIVPNSTTWNPNAIAIPRNFPIILYQDPDGSAWTQSTLDSMQIGVKLIAAGTNRVQVTSVVASVDYTPSTTAVKTLNGLAVASIKTFNGLAIASKKTINGLT